MPIGDLLAQISGERTAPPVPPNRTGTVSLPQKRKPDDDLQTNAPKAVKTGSIPLPNSAPRVQRFQNPRPGENLESAAQKLSLASINSNKHITPGRPTVNGSLSNRNNTNSHPIRQKSAAVSNKHATSAPLDAAEPKQAPKKGSFAEIMARGQRAQATMGQVGKIQHKKVEKALSKRERAELKAEDRKAQAQAKRSSRPPSAARPGITPTSKTSPSFKPTSGITKDRRQTTTTKKTTLSPPTPEKKARKAPTTGYTGTARPKPGSASKEKKKAAPGGVVLNPHLSARYGQSKSSRYHDEEGEELDDFIEYDEEEEEAEAGGARRRYYDSADDSDMEAGLDEIDDEEEQAEYLAKRDDWEEEQRERRRKAEKERRKREALDAMRGRR